MIINKIALPVIAGLKQRTEPELKSELKKGRLLIISPFEKEVKRITTETAIIRNQLMIDLAENVAEGFISKGGNLEKLLRHT